VLPGQREGKSHVQRTTERTNIKTHALRCRAIIVPIREKKARPINISKDRRRKLTRRYSQRRVGFWRREVRVNCISPASANKSQFMRVAGRLAPWSDGYGSGSGIPMGRLCDGRTHRRRRYLASEFSATGQGHNLINEGGRRWGSMISLELDFVGPSGRRKRGLGKVPAGSGRIRATSILIKDRIARKEDLCLLSIRRVTMWTRHEPDAVK